MLITGLTRKYVEFALDERDPIVATEIFCVARRCSQLEIKNRRLEQLIKRAQVIADNDQTELRAGRFPRSWEREFVTGWAAYLRRKAGLIHKYESRRKLERGADDVFALEARNRAMREALDSFADQYSDSTGWTQLLDAYKLEKQKQNECQCCGMGCHTCPTCRKYFDLAEGMRRENLNEEVATWVA